MINLKQQLPHYLKLIRFDSPIGSYLLLWPTLWALWLAAAGLPDLRILLVFVLGVFVMRSAGCAINDFADRDIDGHVARTADRPIASGKISSKEALGVFIALCLFALILALQLNALTLKLSLVALVLAATYPFMKRIHMLPQVHLGTAFAWATPMAYTAITNELPGLSIWLVFLTTVIWTTAYDTMYGMADREDDLKLGLKSTAILFAQHDKLAVGMLQLVVIILLSVIGYLEVLSTPYYLSLIAASGLFVYQQFLIRDREPALCTAAFKNNNWVGMVVFAGIALSLGL